MPIWVYCTYSGTSSSSRSSGTSGTTWALETRKGKDERVSLASRFSQLENFATWNLLIR